MRRLLLVTIALGVFPAGLGLAVYAASGSSLGSPAASARVPTGTIGQPSKPPTATTTTLDARTESDRSARCDEDHGSDDCRPKGETTTGETTTERTTTSDSRSGSNSGSSNSGSSNSGSSNSGSNSGRGSGDDD